MNSNQISLRPDLVRRVKNIALGPTTPSNALIPLFEAVYNSLHAIQDRFGADWCDKGRANIALLDFGAASPSVEIRDNGVGLDEENFHSFLTYDSGHKVQRGGKGVGRLTWLKVFDSAEITSRFLSEGRIIERRFTLVLDNAEPIRNYSLLEAPGAELGTIVKLRRMRTDYVQHMPTKIDTVVRKIVAHFLPYLVSEHVPSIVIETDSDSHDLVQFLESKEIELGSLEVDVGGGQKLKLDHNLLERGVVEGSASHKLYFAANGRVVTTHDIGLPLGLSTYVERNGAHYAYAGVLSGELLDISVNSERTAFDLDDEMVETIKRAALAGIRQILAPQIERVVQQQTELTRNVIKKYPRYSYLISDPRAFVEAKVPRNYKTAEQIYQQLALFDYRENRDIERKVESLSRDDGTSSSDPIEAGVTSVLSRLSAQEFSVLADYTVRRKIVLDPGLFNAY